MVFVTGTDTGVGKTVLTCCLVRSLREAGVPARAVKPLASGGRSDARLLRRSQGHSLAIGEISPWSFPAALSPAIAARRSGGRTARGEVTRWLGRQARAAPVLLVEGAGGLLSPLGDGFDLRDLAADLRAGIILVAANRLGALNQVLLTLEALPSRTRGRTPVVLMSPPRPSLVSRTNAEYLKGRLGPMRVVEFPWLGKGWQHRPLPATAGQALGDLARLLNLLPAGSPAAA